MDERAWCEGCQDEVRYRRTRHGSWHRFFCVSCNAEVFPNVRRKCQNSLDRIGNWMSLMEKRDA